MPHLVILGTHLQYPKGFSLTETGDHYYRLFQKIKSKINPKKIL
jgi:hypothetical protein